MIASEVALMDHDVVPMLDQRFCDFFDEFFHVIYAAATAGLFFSKRATVSEG